MVLEKILSIFRPEPIEIEDLDNAPGIYRELEQEAIEDARARAEEYHDPAEEALDELETFLDDLEGYEDAKDRTIVEDVVDNVAGDRLDMIHDHELPESPRELEKSLDDFIEEFNDVKEKEAAVLDEANLGKELTRAVNDLESVRDDLSGFLENKYRKVETAEELEGLVDEKQEQELEAEDLKMEIEGLENDIEEKENELKEARQDISKLTSSPEWEEYRDMEDKLEWLKQQRKEKELEVGKAASKMERGMKKLVYQIENRDLEFPGDLSILKLIRDGKTDELLSRNTDDINDSVEAATGSLPMDLLDDSVHQRFMDGAQYLMELEGHHSELSQLRNQIENKREELDDHPVREQKKRLEQQKRDLKSELDHLQEDLDDKQDELEDKREELERVEEAIMELLEEGLDREVEFKQK
ncbi:MAG: hypothetical protein ABEJ69_00705 [Candidatus Nanohaloarchaea archaeon]